MLGPTVVRNAKLTEGVTEISFTGGNLPDAFYDEFVLPAFSPAISTASCCSI